MYVYDSILWYMQLYECIHMYIYVYACIIPVQPLVDGHDSVWKWIMNVVGRNKPCIVWDDEFVGQSIQDIWENQHQLLHIPSVDNGGLLPALLVGCGECLKDRHNGLMCKTHQRSVLRIQTAAQVVQTGSQFAHKCILWQPQVDFQLMDGLDKCLYDMHGNSVIIGVHGVLVTLRWQTCESLDS